MHDILLFNEVDFKAKESYWRYSRILYDHSSRHNNPKFVYIKQQRFKLYEIKTKRAER